VDYGIVEDFAGEVVGEPTFVLRSIRREGDQYIYGLTLFNRACEMSDTAPAGWSHAQYLLQHQEQIPVEWRDRNLVFSGTILRGQYGPKLLPQLCWIKEAERWHLFLVRYNSCLSDTYQVVRLLNCSPTSQQPGE